MVTLGQSVKQSCDSVIPWEDKRFLNLMNRTTRMVSGHYELPLPFKNDDTTLPKEEGKNIKREYGKKDIITCLKKIRKNLQNIKKFIARLKDILHKYKYVNKSALQRYFLFVLLLFFKE